MIIMKDKDELRICVNCGLTTNEGIAQKLSNGRVVCPKCKGYVFELIELYLKKNGYLKDKKLKM